MGRSILLIFLGLVSVHAQQGTITAGSDWVEGDSFKFDATFSFQAAQEVPAGYKLWLEFDNEVMLTDVWQYAIEDPPKGSTEAKCWKLKTPGSWNINYAAGATLTSGMQFKIKQTLPKPSGATGIAYIEGTYSSTCSGGTQAPQTTSATTQGSQTTTETNVQTTSSNSQTGQTTNQNDQTTKPNEQTTTAKTTATTTSCSGGSCGETTTQKYSVTTSGQCKCTCPKR